MHILLCVKNEPGFFETDMPLHTSDGSHAADIGTVSKMGDLFPGGKRIGWLKTSDFEGYNRSDGGASESKEKSCMVQESLNSI